MKEYISTAALFWESSDIWPSFKNLDFCADNQNLLVKVKAAMFGKALHRAITVGHPKIKPPCVLGSLLVGDTLNDTAGIPQGSRVVVNPHATNNNSELSIFPGAMSQIVEISGAIEKGVFIIPPAVDYYSAVYCELIACAIQSIKKISKSKKLIIIGCGLMALIQIQVAKLFGIETVCCIYNHSCREHLITEFGGIPIRYSDDHSVLRAKLEPFIDNNAVAIIDSAGSATSAQLLFTLGFVNCEIILFAGYRIGASIPLDLNWIHYNNIDISGCYHFDNECFEEAIGYLEKSVVKIAPLITNTIHWTNFNSIIAKLSSSESISNIVVF